MKFSKALFMRLVWFGVGGAASIAINAGLFRFFHFYIGWNRFLAYALALAIANVVLFIWNYFVGFRTRRQWVGSAWRHAVCLSVANGLDYILVVSLHGLLLQRPEMVTAVAIAGFKVLWSDLVIAGVKVFVAFFKFGLYHYWVYPERKGAPTSAEGGESVTPIDDALPPRAN